MFKVEIKLNGVLTNYSEFATEALCKEWYEENLEAFPKGHQVGYTDIAATLLAAKEKADALKYLSKTDWYVIRKAETGVEVPQEVLTARAVARVKA